MARGRMLDQRFTQSDKLNSVTRDQRLVYASILPYLDRQGRMCAEPMVVKVTVFRRSDFTIEEIAEALAGLAEAELIRLYADKDNEAILEYVNFLDFNSPNTRERKSDYPGPDDSGAEHVRDELLLAALRPDPKTPPTDTARATHVQGQRGVEGNGTERRTENGTKNDMSARADATPEQPQPTTFDTLVEVWNAESGALRKVRDLEVARKNDDLRRLSRKFLTKHGPRALDVFRAGIAAVRTDPHWLGTRASPVKRDGAPYGLLNYLRHVEDKAEIAAELQATNGGKAVGLAPMRPWEEWDIAEHKTTREVATITELLDGGQARMNNGETWDLGECVRCNN